MPERVFTTEAQKTRIGDTRSIGGGIGVSDTYRGRASGTTYRGQVFIGHVSGTGLQLSDTYRGQVFIFRNDTGTYRGRVFNFPDGIGDGSFPG